jgi:hypothetical protein
VDDGSRLFVHTVANSCALPVHQAAQSGLSAGPQLPLEAASNRRKHSFRRGFAALPTRRRPLEQHLLHVTANDAEEP